MKKVILLLMFCVIVLALCSWGNRLAKSSDVDKVELRPDMVPFYLVTSGIQQFFIHPKQNNSACRNNACRNS